MPEQAPQLIGPNAPRDPTMAEVRMVQIQANNIAVQAVRNDNPGVVDTERLALLMERLHAGDVAQSKSEQRGARVVTVLTRIFTRLRNI